MILKFNEHIARENYETTGFNDSNDDSNETLELVGLPSGEYFTITRKQYNRDPRLSQLINWSERLKCYAYRDKDRNKILYLLDIGPVPY